MGMKQAYIIHCFAELENQRIGQPIQQKPVKYTDPASALDLFSIGSVDFQ